MNRWRFTGLENSLCFLIKYLVSFMYVLQRTLNTPGLLLWAYMSLQKQNQLVLYYWDNRCVCITYS